MSRRASTNIADGVQASRVDPKRAGMAGPVSSKQSSSAKHGCRAGPCRGAGAVAGRGPSGGPAGRRCRVEGPSGPITDAAPSCGRPAPRAMSRGCRCRVKRQVHGQSRRARPRRPHPVRLALTGRGQVRPSRGEISKKRLPFGAGAALVHISPQEEFAAHSRRAMSWGEDRVNRRGRGGGAPWARA